MTIGIVGLGLIGGSLAAAFKKSGHRVLGMDSNKTIQDFALLAGSIDGVLTIGPAGPVPAARNTSNEKTVSVNADEIRATSPISELDTDAQSCDVIFIAVSPKNAESWIRENAQYLVNQPAEQTAGNQTPEQTADRQTPEQTADSQASEYTADIQTADRQPAKAPLVIDCCGTKRNICRAGFDAAAEYGFTFIGGHPMAGKQFGGYKNSSAELFDGAFFALVPNDANGDSGNIALLSTVQSILKDAGFTRFAVMTPDEHDQIIAFTSQMAHLISNAYIKSDMAEVGIGAQLSGGAFRDMTRVAYLDEGMWTELFMENRDNMLSELNGFIGELERYRNAIEARDENALAALLAEGKRRKEQISQ